MKSKLISIPYTLGIIKPHIALQENKVDDIFRLLDKHNFEVFHSVRKILSREEVLNLFYKYRSSSYYSDIEEHMMTAESIVMLLINKVETVYDPEKELTVKLESPIARWKELIGDKNPDVAKGQETVKGLKKLNEETGEITEGENQPRLRGIYGKNEIRNAFWGSDDAKAANKERDIFLLPVPEKPPVFEYIKNKVTIDNILKFMFPPNLEHSNSTGRLDLFALYGPTVHYHSVDSCFCHECIGIAKEQLNRAIQKKQDLLIKTTGSIKVDSIKPTTLRGTGTISKTNRLMEAPKRLLQEEDINEIFRDLCPKCQQHVEGFVHLTCGRGSQHINSDIEITEMINEVNRNDILELLIVEKGSTAKMMIQTLKLHEPAEIMYQPRHLEELLKDLETDYYERYEFNDLQKMILEDRRLRINYWVSQIIHKPIEKFKNPNLLNQNEKVDRNDIKNPYFSLSRILPISLHMERTKVVAKDEKYDKLHFDFKKKYIQAEQDLVMEKTVSKEYHRITDITQPKSSTVSINSMIIRNYNDGRHGGWNNYCCYQG